jgi:CRP/FNR family cyclic AMP-dependent transcriptional regulator
MPGFDRPALSKNCGSCALQTQASLCNLPTLSLQALEKLSVATIYPAGSILFIEGQPAKGVFVLCQGRAKLSASASDGKTLILKIAEAGEALGLSSTISGRPYALTAEAIEPCQISLVRREDFLQFLREDTDACLRTAEQLAEKYIAVCQELRSLGLHRSAAEKISQFLLEWNIRHGRDGSSDKQPWLQLGLTHEEIAQVIGASRETVSRIFANLKRQRIVETHGTRLLIRNRAALERMVGL